MKVLEFVVLWLLSSITGVYGEMMDDSGVMNVDNMMNGSTVNNDMIDHRMSTNEEQSIVPVAHEGGHHHGMPILEMNLTPSERLYWENYNTTTFFNTDQGNRFSLWYHSITCFIVVTFSYPICLALNNAESKWYLPMLFLHELILVSSLISLSIFDFSLDEIWYPNNAYRPMSWILFILSIAHFISAIVVQSIKWAIGDDYMLNDYSENGFIPLNNYGQHEESENYNSPITLDFSINNQININPESKNRNKSDSFEIHDNDLLRDIENKTDNLKLNNDFFTRNKLRSSKKRDIYLGKVFYHPLIQKSALHFSRIFGFIFNALNYSLMAYLLIYIPVGLAVGNLLGRGNKIFNLLAHWIKGGVFFVLGLVSLSRYCGFGTKYGWAWNKIVVMSDQIDKHSIWYKLMPSGTITMDAIESFLIFFYGSTNIFLEHLANPNGKWSAKDLQHASIAFMFIGCGLCGLLIEYKLNKWRFNQGSIDSDIPVNDIYASSPGYSLNPFPAFTIFWTGILMSKHEQASELSTSIHVQWGYLLSYGSFFRIFTLFLMILVPNKNTEPAKPFTELITSFCLLCGGLIFMESTDQIVESLEYRGLTPMFTFNISVGIIVLIMAWQLMLFMWKDWLKKSHDEI